MNNVMLAHPFYLNQKTILLTGASSGIGRETAIQLSRLGARLVLVGRNQDALKKTEEQLQGKEHLIAPCDLNQHNELSGWLGAIVQETGLFYGLAHCAGMHFVKPLKLMEYHDYQSIFQTNVAATFTLCKAFCHKLISTRPASIVLVSSVAGIQGQAGISAYSASKGALIALTKSLAMEFAAEKLRVNCVLPGIVQTPMTEKLFNKMTKEQIQSIADMHPLGFGVPEDVAYSIAFLLSDAARWITGSHLIVDGGYSAH